MTQELNPYQRYDNDEQHGPLTEKDIRQLVGSQTFDLIKDHFVVQGIIRPAEFAEGVARLEAEDKQLLRELIERGAAHAHDTQWTGWMKYLFSKGTWNDDGSFTIAADSAARWKRQSETPYAELSEQERASDRKEARQWMDLFGVLDLDENL